jgi:hypothetical protein
MEGALTMGRDEDEDGPSTFMTVEYLDIPEAGFAGWALVFQAAALPIGTEAQALRVAEAISEALNRTHPKTAELGPSLIVREDGGSAH